MAESGGEQPCLRSPAVPSRDSPCVPCTQIGERDPCPHRVESALGRLGNKPKMGPKSPKNKSQLTCRVYFFITLYFENVKPNPKAKNLHLGSPVNIFATFALSRSLSDGFAESFESEFGAASYFTPPYLGRCL